ncbi:Hypothetical predicted protein [Podarcis lilfordi]|uniref:Uncharacterized protein n=1 Tax=Podarcis lilfordi TaxID=74358 RepID=A0AA35KE57_9SAUR|nr:Hypothetical predicted protein [Podarcis lilfordi]
MFSSALKKISSSQVFQRLCRPKNHALVYKEEDDLVIVTHKREVVVKIRLIHVQPFKAQGMDNPQTKAENCGKKKASISSPAPLQKDPLPPSPQSQIYK